MGNRELELSGPGGSKRAARKAAPHSDSNLPSLRLSFFICKMGLALVLGHSTGCKSPCVFVPIGEGVVY